MKRRTFINWLIALPFVRCFFRKQGAEPKVSGVAIALKHDIGWLQREKYSGKSEEYYKQVKLNEQHKLEESDRQIILRGVV